MAVNFIKQITLFMFSANTTSKTYLILSPIVCPLILISILLLTPHDCAALVEGRRIPATGSAQYSAPNYGPELAVDGNGSTLWISNLTPSKPNNNVWYQLDLGKVRQVARLHWLAAAGTPYPASAPNKFQVIVSTDGSRWVTVYSANTTSGNATAGDILLNTDARYVRLVTSKVNDGTGWALGFREIWVTEGRDTTSMWRVKSVMSNGRIELKWQTQIDPQVKRLLIFRSTTPIEVQGTLVATLGASASEYLDKVPNWTPYYYWIKAIDNKGVILDTSAKTAAFAHPKEEVSYRIESFAFWYELYKPPTDPDATIRHIGKAAFVVGTGGSSITDLAKLGIGVLPYVTLYQSSQAGLTFPKDTDANIVAAKIAPIAFYKNNLQFPDSPAGYLPTVFCRPDNIEYTPKSIQYTTCPNSVHFRDIVLTQVNKQLSSGVFGFFVDNGYRDPIAATTVCQSTSHAHYYGENLTSADAFLGMLMEITCAIKKKNPNGILMMNGGVPLESNFYGLSLYDVVDGVLWESYLRSSYSTPKEHSSSWDSVYRLSIDLEKKWLMTPPQRTYVLSYPWDRDEAFFCYATAKLFNLPWSAGVGIADPTHAQFGGHFGAYPELVNLRLGAPIDAGQYGGEKIGEVYVRRYEKGFVVVNPAVTKQNIVLPPLKRSKIQDIFAGKTISADSIRASLPPQSGRVYLY